MNRFEAVATNDGLRVQMEPGAFRVLMLLACGERPGPDERAVLARELRDVAGDLEAMEAIPCAPPSRKEADRA